MGSDSAQIAAQIRFALERLSERNAQHEWEHLCRHLTRACICSNILPATGPVQAGGDQGRDFETFHTYLSRSPLAKQSFVGLISDEPIAFACTLERDIESKVHHDVKTIMSSGILVKRIYLFNTHSIPVAKRHKLQNWANSTYAVNIEILDGEAIAELLSAHDTFWIAERYLELPTQLLPTLPPKEARDWYTRVLDKWRRTTHPAQTFADFAEIQTAARIALGPFAYAENGHPINSHERPELPFWIERLDEITDCDVISPLHRRAFYEASVLRLRGLNTLIGQEERIRIYFKCIAKLEDITDLEDAEALLAYLFSASRAGLVHITDAEVRTWFRVLESRLDECLQEAKQHIKVNTRCTLLEIRAHVALFSHLNHGKMNPEDALRYWQELTQLIKQAPLFPLERFADRLNEYARYLGMHPAYEPRYCIHL